MLYHVTDRWDGGDLQPAIMRYGNRAIDLFQERWPDAPVEMAAAHVHKIFFFKSLAEALEHLGILGDTILMIDDADMDIDEDPIEGYPTTSDIVSADNIAVYEEDV